MNEPIIKITINTKLLVDLLRSAADALQAADAAGMGTITFNHDTSIRNFLRFCLGVDALKDEL